MTGGSSVWQCDSNTSNVNNIIIIISYSNGASHVYILLCFNVELDLQMCVFLSCFVYVGILIKKYGYEMMTKAKTATNSNKYFLSRHSIQLVGIQIYVLNENQIVFDVRLFFVFLDGIA